MEALLNREGGIDWRWSSDFEDIIKLIRECDLTAEFAKVDNPRLLQFVNQTFQKFISDEAYFKEACASHLIKPFYVDGDIDSIMTKIQAFINTKY